MLRFLERGAGHVAEVVTGGEHRAVGGDDDAEGVGVAGPPEGRGQRLHHVDGECVALLRTVERDRDDVAATFLEDR